MKKVISKIKNKGWDKYDIAGWVIIALAFVANCIIIYKGTWAFIHSDGATVITLAREQWRQKKIFPDNWNYGTDIWSIGLNTLILPFFKLCKHWLNARVCAVIVQTLLMIASVLWLKKSGLLGKYWCITALTMLIPISEVITEHWYFQATYMTAILWLIVMMQFTFWCIDKGAKKRLAGAVLLLLVVISRVSMGYSMILVFSAPMLAALLLLGLMELHKGKMANKNLIKKLILAGSAIILGTVIGILFNSVLSGKLNLARTATGGYAFTDFYQLDDSLGNMFGCFARLFGAADTGNVSLLSLNGINKALAFVYLCFTLFFVPYSLIKKFDRIKSVKQRLCIIFMMVSSFATMYIFVFAAMPQARYLIWIYFYSVINLGIWIANYRVFSYGKELKVCFVVFIAVLSLGMYTYYLTYDYDSNPDCLGVNNTGINYKVDRELLSYLEEKNYTYGYAGYWQSYSNMVASDGKIKIAALKNDWTGPYYWLNTGNWYKEENHSGKCFLLVTDSQYDEELPDLYKSRAIREECYNGYHILLYKGINDMWKIWGELNS